jgi:hypothetical protein
MRNLFTQQLEEILKLLDEIFNQREVDGDSYGYIKMTELAPLQKRLNNELNNLWNNHCCLLVFLSNLDEAKQWRASVIKASKDRNPINTDVCQRSDIELLQAIEQAKIYLELTVKAQKKTLYIWAQIKQNWFSYLLALITGIVTGILGNYLFSILK